MKKYRKYFACAGIVALSSMLLSGVANAEKLSPSAYYCTNDVVGTCIWSGANYQGNWKLYYPTPYGQCTTVGTSGESAFNESSIDQVLYAGLNCTGDAVRLCAYSRNCLAFDDGLPFYPNSIGG